MEMTPSPDSTAPEAKPLKWWQRKVTVCDKCFQATCWQGKFMCYRSANAGIVELTIAELIAHNTGEHPSHWEIPDSRQEGGEDSKQAVQILWQLDALIWASWLQSVSPKAREEIETAVATIRKLILYSAMSRKEGGGE